MSHYSVQRCVCRRADFKTLKQIATDKGYDSVEDFQEQQIAGDGCGLCIPYMREMLKTGKTSFEPGSVYKNKSA